LICGPDDIDVTPPLIIDPISPEKIALIENVMAQNDITCSDLQSYLADNSTTCARGLNPKNNATNAPAPFRLNITGSSIIEVDVETLIGGNFQLEFTPTSDEEIVLFTLSGMPAGTSLSYILPGQSIPRIWNSTGIGSVLDIKFSSEDELKDILNTLKIKSAPESDEDFIILVGVATDPLDPSKYMEFEHPVKVVPSPDPPMVRTTGLSVS
jgi:hypothetical protein